MCRLSEAEEAMNAKASQLLQTTQTMIDGGDEDSDVIVEELVEDTVGDNGEGFARIAPRCFARLVGWPQNQPIELECIGSIKNDSNNARNLCHGKLWLERF